MQITHEALGEHSPQVGYVVGAEENACRAAILRQCWQQ